MTALWGGGGLYQAWVSFLDAFSAGEPADPDCLPRLEKADFTGDSWVRLTDRLTGALAGRMQVWAAVLSRALQTARDEFEVARAMADARGGLLPVRALAQHPALPADLTERLVKLVDDQIHQVQRTLEDEVRRLGRDGASRDLVERRLGTVRDNSLSVVAGRPPDSRPADARSDTWYVDPSVARRRRVMAHPPVRDR